MKKIVYIWILALFVFPVYAMDKPEIEIVIDQEASPEALFINVRLKHDEKRGWLLKGRLSRAAKNNKVPHGVIRAKFTDQLGQRIAIFDGEYKPLFVHRKTDRASYFTIPVAQSVMSLTTKVTVSHRRDTR